MGCPLQGDPVQQCPLVLGHEALGGAGVVQQVGGHVRHPGSLVGLEHVLVWLTRQKF